MHHYIRYYMYLLLSLSIVHCYFAKMYYLLHRRKSNHVKDTIA